MNKRTSIKDIAESVGVSTALVSYVLNNKEEKARINKETAKRVREAARKMHYSPNQVAKNLKSGKSLEIGLVVADISNPFFGNLARTIEDESKKKGYTVLFGSSDENSEKFYRVVEILINRQIDGIIIAPAEGTEAQLNYLKKEGIPFVLIDRYFKDIDTSYVVIDNFEATYKATTHLLEGGHKNIAFVCYKNKLQHTEDRYRGYIKALEDFGKGYKKKVCEVEYNNPAYFNKQFKKLLASKNKIDAILFSTNTLSIMGLKILIELNIKVPDDVAVFCFDQSDSYDLFYCPVSYVQQPLAKIGQEAVRILIDQIAGKKDSRQKVVLNSEPVIRASSASHKN